MDNYKVVNLGCDPWSEELKLKILEFPHYKTAKMWIENIDIAMVETPYYQWLKNELDINGSVWNGILNNEYDITKQYENFKRLFRIAPNFVEHEMMNRVINGCTHYFGPICVKIENDGGISIWDGMHRISILFALGYPIRFTICERQDKWQKIVDDLRQLYPTLMYQSIPHPDFEDWNYCNNDIKELAIKGIVEEHKIKSVLDLGSCHGHVLYSIKKLLNSAIGVEYNRTRYNVLKLLFDKIGFVARNDNFFDVVEQCSQSVDCVFALAVLHHFSKENPIEKFEKLLDHIRRISNMLLYELPEPNEEQYAWMYQDVDMHDLIRSRYKDKTIIQMQNRKLVLLKG
jgi:phospholipid N-methyltransferase